MTHAHALPVPADGPHRDELAPNALRHWAARTPDAIALEHADGRRRTYRESEQAALHWAHALHRTGIGPGDRVAFLLADPLEAAAVWLGIAISGGVAVPVNNAHFGRMLRHVLADSGAGVLVVAGVFVDRVTAIADELPDLRRVVLTGADTAQAPGLDVTRAEDFLRPPEKPADESDFVGPEPHDTAAILYTSGTTGPSKGVVAPWAAMAGYWSWVPDDTLTAGEGLYCPLALFHISGLGALHYATSRGGRFITRDRFSAQAFWADVRASGAVAAGLVGPMTAVLDARPEAPDDADNPLRSLILGPMIPRVAQFERRFGIRVATGYGMTEIPPVLATTWDHGPWQNCGVVRAGAPWAEVRIVDEHDLPVARGEIGELVVRTGTPWALNAGYHNLPDATAAAWRNGWFHTGDAFRQDTEGRYYFVDRIKDAIRRRAENISSFEVEAFVLDHPAVAECAAYGVPDQYGGDEVMIATVPAQGNTLDPAELLAFLERHMPAYMLPRYVDLVDELPRNTTSLRIQKHILRERGVGAGTWDRAATPTPKTDEEPDGTGGTGGTGGTDDRDDRHDRHDRDERGDEHA